MGKAILRLAIILALTSGGYAVYSYYQPTAEFISRNEVASGYVFSCVGGTDCAPSSDDSGISQAIACVDDKLSASNVYPSVRWPKGEFTQLVATTGVKDTIASHDGGSCRSDGSRACGKYAFDAAVNYQKVRRLRSMWDKISVLGRSKGCGLSISLIDKNGGVRGYEIKEDKYSHMHFEIAVKNNIFNYFPWLRESHCGCAWGRPVTTPFFSLPSSFSGCKISSQGITCAPASN